MTEADVRRQVRREIESIRAQESGVLPPTPYVVLEVIRRCKTLKPWEGIATTEPIGKALRVLVEQILEICPLRLKGKQVILEVEDFRTMPPMEAANSYGTRKHRHLRKVV